LPKGWRDCCKCKGQAGGAGPRPFAWGVSHDL
jgi:hypothetical protein